MFRSNSKTVHRERPAIGRRLAEHVLQERIYVHLSSVVRMSGSW